MEILTSVNIATIEDGIDMKQYLSFDFGGTYIKYGLVDHAGDISIYNKVSTPSSLDELLKIVANITNEYKREYRLEGVAVSCPGTITEDGEVKGTSAIPYFYNLSLKKTLEDLTGEFVSIENDANCAALAELWNGSANAHKEVIVIVIGTGVGGAIISDGKLHRGANLMGGEFGYTILKADSTTKQVNYWSEMGSTAALIRNVAVKKSMNENELSGELIFNLAKDGDMLCKQAIDEFYFILATGVHNLQHIFDPEKILIGGGISVREDFITRLTTSITQVQKSMDLNSIKPNIDTCAFLNKANLIGATYSYIQTYNS